MLTSDDLASVVSIAGLDGTPSSAKVTPLRVFPRKGRGTGGVRCQRLLKSEVGIMAAAVAVDVGGCFT